MSHNEKLRQRFIALVERIRVTPGSNSGPLRVVIRYPKQPDVRLGGAVAKLYNDVLTAFTKQYAPVDSSPVSRAEVAFRFDRAIQSALGSRGQGQSTRSIAFGRRLKREIAKLQTLLQSEPVDWRVYVPLHAPHVDRPARVGRVELVPGKSKTVTQLRTQLPDVADAFEVATVARLTVKAVDAVAARTIAINTLRHTLDVLNFVAPSLEAPYLDPEAAFEAIEAPGISAIVAVHGGRASYSRIHFNVAVRKLPRKLLQTKMERAVEALLSNVNPSALHRRVANALAWAGRANVQRRRDQAFLMKMIALESALTRSDVRSSTTERLRVRVAQVVGGTDTQRRAIYHRMGELYQIRSSIVHAGAADILTDELLKEIGTLTRKVLERLLLSSPFRRMSSEGELESWFERRLLGGARNPPAPTQETPHRRAPEG